MKAIKPKSNNIKRNPKQDRERKVLIGLIEFYLKTGKPVGSNTLRDEGFEDLSSATIRNYFAQLEEDGYLIQQHSSGGRIPTAKSFKFYAKEFFEENKIDEKGKAVFDSYKQQDDREIVKLLREAAQDLSDLSSCAVFLSAPRFDNDFIADIKVVAIDHSRCLCILVTDFGMIQTEVLYTDRKMSTFAAKRIESYFEHRLTGQNKPLNLSEEEEALAHKFYNEVMVRYLVTYSTTKMDDLFTTGFSHLLTFPELQDLTTLTCALELYENTNGMKLLLKDCMKHGILRYWISDDLQPYTHHAEQCAVVAAPYFISSTPVGAVGLLGPLRMPYRKLFQQLRAFSDCISEALTKNVFKYKLDFKTVSPDVPYIENEKHLLIDQSRSQRMLLEEK